MLSSLNWNSKTKTQTKLHLPPASRGATCTFPLHAFTTLNPFRRIGWLIPPSPTALDHLCSRFNNPNPLQTSLKCHRSIPTRALFPIARLFRFPGLFGAERVALTTLCQTPTGHAHCTRAAPPFFKSIDIHLGMCLTCSATPPQPESTIPVYAAPFEVTNAIHHADFYTPHKSSSPDT